MRLSWAIAAGLALGIAIAWWLSRDPPEVVEARQARAEQAAAERAEAARPVLYRWTDANGVVQVTQEPPPGGRRYETVDIEPRDGIEVHGTRR
ncbi:DUF4124 domain-containing protein [Luteimonas vadosa]|uniref:DUF4124 domain-containing protein n=1 Tax=Luteimonas vadosa TaxID=1165507 RepID=A0ABP9DMX8_9GAMM